MAYSAGTLDTATLTSQAILHVSDGIHNLKVKFPKTKPTGTNDATDAAWQTRMTNEVVAAHNATLASGQSNATPLLANLA